MHIFYIFIRCVEYLVKQSYKKINDSVTCDLLCNCVLANESDVCIFKASVLDRCTETACEKKAMFCKRENLYFVLLLSLNIVVCVLCVL
jgi:hypothetical protein